MSPHAAPLHQGGIVDLPNGDWWGFSMMDFKSVGRTTFLSPVTWKERLAVLRPAGQPLGRSPRAPGSSPPSPPRSRPRPPSAQRRFLRREAPAGLAVEPRARRRKAWSPRSPVPAPAHVARRAVPRRSNTTQRVIGPAFNKQRQPTPGCWARMPLPVYSTSPAPDRSRPCTESGHVLRWYNQVTDTTIDRPLDSAREPAAQSATTTLTWSKASASVPMVAGLHAVRRSDPPAIPAQDLPPARYAPFAYNTWPRGALRRAPDSFLVELLADARRIPAGKVTARNLANDRRLGQPQRYVLGAPDKSLQEFPPPVSACSTAGRAGWRSKRWTAAASSPSSASAWATCVLQA